MTQKQIFVVLDTETTKRNGLVFDAGWTSIDRKGNHYGKGSYLFRDVLVQDDPFYREKIGNYWEMAWQHDVRPITFANFRDRFNRHLNKLRKMNFEPIICAYNAAFDTRQLSLTAMKMLGKRFLTHPTRLLDIWDAWASSCPKRYIAERSASGNVRSRAEDVYKFEMKLPHFEEAHTGYEDTKIEAQILLKVLARKQSLPIVTHPSQFCGDPWRKVQQRIEKFTNPTKEEIRDNFAPAAKAGA